MFDVGCFPRCSNRALPAAIGTAAVEVNQDFARLGTVALTDDAAIFQFVHDARGAAVTEAQAAVQQRDARLLFAADDFDALLDDFLVLVNAAFDVIVRRGFGKLFVDLRFVAGLGLPCDEAHDVFQFFVSDERALRAFEIRGTGRQVKHVAFAEQFVRAHRIENRPGIHAAGDLEGDARRDVRLDDAGDDVHGWPLRGDDAMNARRARHLRDARDGHFHIRRRHEHQVRQFVNDDDDIGKFFGNDDVVLARHDNLFVHFDGETIRARLDFFLFDGERQFGFLRRQRFVLGPFVEGFDVADADARENLVALFHFVDAPARGKQTFFGSVTTGTTRCGSALYCCNSTTFG